MRTSSAVFNLQTTTHSTDRIVQSDVQPGLYSFSDGRDCLRFQSLSLGSSDFTIAIEVECSPDSERSGDIISQFDTATRTGFSLGFSSLDASCSSRATVGQLSFGIDAQTEPLWVDVGQPGDTTVHPYGFCEYQGDLYVATCSADENGRGGVYRFESPNKWIDCKCPCVSNAVTALAAHDGVLYAASSSYDTRGTHLAAAGNMAPDGHVYGYDGTQWRDYGKVADCQILYGLTVLDGTLYVSAFEMFTDADSHPGTGLYRMSKPGHWEYCGNPGERIGPITARDGKIIGGGYNKGGVYAYDPKLGHWEDWGRPPYEKTTQLYSFVEYNGELLVGTWKDAKVFAIEAPHRFRDLGLLGSELEVMGMGVYNGKLYAGTLPLAQIYRYEGGAEWTLIDRLEHTETEFRRAWSMGLHGGRLFCGVVPSGRVYAMTAGCVATVDEALPKGKYQITAVRKGGELTIYIDGKRRSRQAALPEWQKAAELDISNDKPLTIGAGPRGPWRGNIASLRILSYAMTEEEITREAPSSALE